MIFCKCSGPLVQNEGRAGLVVMQNESLQVFLQPSPSFDNDRGACYLAEFSSELVNSPLRD